MNHMENQNLQELLFELGYDEREFRDDDGWEYNLFMAQQVREARREAQRYLDELDYDHSDDYYLNLKHGNNQRIRGEQN